MSTITRLAFVILAALGIFQLAEYMVCGGLGWSNVEWSRVGYSAIALLPALGIHMVAAVAGKKEPVLVGVAYATCAAFVGFFLIGQGAINGQTCYANYSVFDAHKMSVLPFMAYYYGWLAIGTYLTWHWSGQITDVGRQTALRSLTIGYLFFIVPTTAFNVIDPSTVKAIPSIMCGFAVLLAFVIILRVLPNTCATNKNPVKSLREMLRI